VTGQVKGWQDKTAIIIIYGSHFGL